MAGMLPGVELARRRRANHHSSSSSSFSYRCRREPSFHYHHHHQQQRLEPASNGMGETALKARRKLDEKLGLSSVTRCETLPTLSKDVIPTATKLQRTSWSPKLKWRKLERLVGLELELEGEKHIFKIPCYYT